VLEITGISEYIRVYQSISKYIIVAYIIVYNRHSIVYQSISQAYYIRVYHRHIIVYQSISKYIRVYHSISEYIRVYHRYIIVYQSISQAYHS